MARKPKFDEARRALDAALEDLGADEVSGEASGPPNERPGGQPPAAGAARVAPRRRSGAVQLRAEPGARAQVEPASNGGATVRLPEAQGPAGAQRDGRAPGSPAFPRAVRPVEASLAQSEENGTGPGTATAADAGAAMLNAEPVRPGDAGADGEISARPPAPTTEALVRLVVGAALLGLDGLAARGGRWEAEAGLAERRPPPQASEGEIGSGRFRHALIGRLCETEEQLRPRGNPISWLRAVVSYAFGTVFAVVVDLLPLPRFRRGKGVLAEPSDEETRRWARRGKLEEAQSRRFARAALEDIVDNVIVYLAQRPAVGEALGAIVRSPAMDDAVRQIMAGPAVEEAIVRVAASPALDKVIVRVAASPALDEVVAKVAASPALDQAIGQIVRAPGMQDAVTYLVNSPAMEEAIETLSKSPALVALVTTQSTSVVSEIVGEVRERAVSGDKLVEALVRRLLRRQPRSALPLEARGLVVSEGESGRRRQRGGGDGA